jgi:hypothetical protein
VNREKTTGKCLCGAVKFEIVFPTDFVAHCHCHSCRLSHGAPFVSWTSVPLDRFRLLSGGDVLRWYRSSEYVEWGFCPQCGSSMLYRAVGEGHPESPRTDCMYISAASLERIDRDPQSHVSFEEHSRLLAGFTSIARHRGKTDEIMAKPEDWS